VGVDHNMSKRTKVYAQYVRLSNDTNASYGLNGAGATGSVAALGDDANPSAGPSVCVTPSNFSPA